MIIKLLKLLVYKDWYLNRGILIPLLGAQLLCVAIIELWGDIVWQYASLASLFIFVGASIAIAPRIFSDGKDHSLLFSLSPPISPLHYLAAKFTACYLPYLFIYGLTAYVYYRMGIICEANPQNRAFWHLMLITIVTIFSFLFAFNAVARSPGFGYTIVVGMALAVFIYTSIFIGVENNIFGNRDIAIWDPAFIKIIVFIIVCNIVLLFLVALWQIKPRDIN